MWNDAVELVVVQEPRRLRLPDLRELGHRGWIALDVAIAHGETHHRVEGADVVVDRLRREPGISQPGDQPFVVSLDDLGDEHVAEQGLMCLRQHRRYDCCWFLSARRPLQARAPR